MKDRVQPICRACFAAFSLGRGDSPQREPTALAETTDQEPCLICGEETRIFVRVDPKLIEGLTFAREKEPE